MALTNGQAFAVNTLLRRLCGLPGVGGMPSDEDARRAAMELAAASYKHLTAGLQDSDVAAAWPSEIPQQPVEVRAAAERLRMDVYETIQAVYGEIGGQSDAPDAAEADQRRIVVDLRLVLDWTVTAAGGA